MENGTSLLTTDGGESWKRDLEAEQDIKGTNFNIQLHTVKFRNHTEAWAIDSQRTILTTQNQGKSWEAMNFLLDEGTTDGEAKSWTERMVEERPFGFSMRITNAHLLRDGHCWVVSGEQIFDREPSRADIGGSERIRRIYWSDLRHHRWRKDLAPSTR